MPIFVDFHEKVGRADVKRLKGVQRCQRHCLPIATCLLTTNDLLVSVQKRQGKARRERERSRTNYANWRLACSTLIPASKMTRPEFLRVRVVPIQLGIGVRALRSIICDGASLSYNLLFPCNLILTMGSGA